MPKEKSPKAKAEERAPEAIMTREGNRVIMNITALVDRYQEIVRAHEATEKQSGARHVLFTDDREFVCVDLTSALRNLEVGNPLIIDGVNWSEQ